MLSTAAYFFKNESFFYFQNMKGGYYVLSLLYEAYQHKDIKMKGKKMDNHEKIKIMLKGAVDHTDILEIAQKLKSAQKKGKRLIVKLGLDPSAPDIHLGHAVVLRKIKQLQDLGCEIIIIIGDFTGMIGDPTGKSKSRKQLSQEETLKNAKTYQDQIFKIIQRENTQVLFNSQWLSKLNFADVVSLASKCTIARMLERDDFANRYREQKPISMHEFLYPLMQAYDSVAIEADIEIGGTDQTFNILMGRKIQREYNQEPQITIFMPLLEGTDGVEKMSKSLGNYIGINESANVMYEKIMKIPDCLIIKYYKLCTDIHPDTISDIISQLDLGHNPRDIKMHLAKEIISLYHSEADVANAICHFKTVFQKGKAPDDMPVLTIDTSCNTKLLCDIIIDELVKNKYYTSKSQVRRLIQQNAVSYNGDKINSSNCIKNINDGDILKIGKSKFFKLIIKK